MRAPKKQPNKYFWDPPDKEWLEHQYLTLKKSAVEISYDIGASPGGNTVLEWLRRLGVSSRTHSQAVSLTKRGSNNPNWKKGRSRGFGKRNLLRKGYPRVCALCGTTEHLDVHHLDGDATNNTLENLEYRCHECHMRGHRRGILTEAEAQQIRAGYETGEYSLQEIADEFGVSKGAICDITSGRTWKRTN